jgi:hypothetical protein
MTPNDRIKLRILRSDLDDAKNPKMLAKYPHLGSPEYIEHLERIIKKMEDADGALAFEGR